MYRFAGALAFVSFALATSVSTAQTARPSTWSCPQHWWSDDLCDCGCGAYDRDDCSDADPSSCEYTNSMCWDPEAGALATMSSANWRCSSGSPPTEQRTWDWQEYWPQNWWASAQQYTDNVCSCGYGAFDMACDTPYWYSCEQSACPGAEDPYNNWDCFGFMGPQWWYNSNDGCDCGWGKFDPDCVDARIESCQFFAPSCQVNPEANWACEPLSLGDYLPDTPYCDPHDGYDPFTTPLEEATLVIINKYRAEGYACPGWYSPPTHPLWMDGTLRCAARPHSEDLVAQRVAAHDGFSERLTAAGVVRHDSIPAGEIISYHYNLDRKLQGLPYNSPPHSAWSYADGLVQAWLGSPTHCAIMMSPSYDKAGIGVAGPWQRQNSTIHEAIATVVLAAH